MLFYSVAKLHEMQVTERAMASLFSCEVCDIYFSFLPILRNAYEKNGSVTGGQGLNRYGKL